MDDRCSWKELMDWLLSGNIATAYFSTNGHRILYVHVGRRELNGPTTLALQCDPMFHVGEVSDDLMAEVTLTDVARDFASGMKPRDIRRKHDLEHHHYDLMTRRLRQLDPIARAKHNEYSRRYRERYGARQLKREGEARRRRVELQGVSNG